MSSSCCRRGTSDWVRGTENPFWWRCRPFTSWWCSWSWTWSCHCGSSWWVSIAHLVRFGCPGTCWSCLRWRTTRCGCWLCGVTLPSYRLGVRWGVSRRSTYSMSCTCAPSSTCASSTAIAAIFALDALGHANYYPNPNPHPNHHLPTWPHQYPSPGTVPVSLSPLTWFSYPVHCDRHPQSISIINIT